MQNKLYQPVIVRKDIDDTHYYYVDDKFVPSVTTILQEGMPTPYALKHWIGEVGNEKAELKMNKAADRGSLLHDACERLLNGLEINLKEEFLNKGDKRVLVGFVNWFYEFQPQVNKIEFTVASSLGFAGTLDLDCDIDPKRIFEKTKFKTDNPNWIIDFKSSGGVYDSHKLQVVGYKHCKLEMTGKEANMGILHLNTLVKKGYTFHTDMRINKKPVTIEDFMCVYNMYKMINGGVIPEPDLTEVYPDILKLEKK